MSEHIRVIEIEGQKFEIDTRTARKIEQFRVGDRVKVLLKVYSGYETKPGVIVGIDAFKNLPTVVIAYVPSVWGTDARVEFAYLNSASKDMEIVPMCEDELMPTRDTILGVFERSISQKRKEIEDIGAKRDYFLRQYGAVVGASLETVE
jgi:hypothetical protein